MQTDSAAISAYFQTFMDHSPAVAWMKDEQGRHVYLSEPYLQQIGIPCQDWYLKTDFDLWPDAIAKRFQKIDQEILDSGSSMSFEDQENFTLPGQRMRTWLVTKFPLCDASGDRYVGGLAIDISEQKNTQEALRSQNAVNEHLIQSARNIVLVLDNDQKIVRFNRTLQDLSGWTLEEIKGENWTSVFLKSEMHVDQQRRFESASQEPYARGYVLPIYTRYGETLEIEWYNSPLVGSDGAREGLLCIGANTTAKRCIELQMEQITESEQRRIGRELHDGIGQELTALKLFSEHLVDQIRHLTQESPESSSGLSKIGELAAKITSGLRATSDGVQKLSRSMVSEGGGSEMLLSLLSTLASTTNSLPNFECTFRYDDGLPNLEALEDTTATHLYRIAQEAVNNAVKHSGGTKIELTLSGNDSGSSMEIRDNGTGFQQSDENLNSMGIGLQVMQYRADLIHAEFNISQNKNGTRVLCTLRHKP